MVGVKSYFEKLSRNLFETYALSTDKIEITSDIEDIILDIDTVVPLGLILNELITNALKYAFPSGRGVIHVSIEESYEGLVLSVKDNGVGMENVDELQSGDSFGYDSINSFVEKMDGELEVRIDNGTEIKAILKNYKKAA